MPSLVGEDAEPEIQKQFKSHGVEFEPMIVSAFKLSVELWFQTCFPAFSETSDRAETSHPESLESSGVEGQNGTGAGQDVTMEGQRASSSNRSIMAVRKYEAFK